MENIEQLKQDNAKLQERLNNAAKFFREQKAQIESLTNEVKEKTELALDYRNQIESKDKAYKTLQETYNEVFAENKQLKDQVDSCEFNAESDANNLEDLNKQLNEYELKLQNSEAAYEELRKKYTEVKALSDDSIQAGVELGKENAELRAKIHQLENNSISQEDFDDEVKKLNQTISECKKSYDEKVEDISKLQMKIEKLNADNETLRKSDKASKEAYEQQKKENKETEEQFNKVLNTYELDLVKVQNDLKEKSEQLDKLNKLYDNCENEKLGWESDYNNLKDQYELLKVQATVDKECAVKYEEMYNDYKKYKDFVNALFTKAKEVHIEWASPEEIDEYQKKTLNKSVEQKKNTKSETPMMNVSEMTRML